MKFSSTFYVLAGVLASLLTLPIVTAFPAPDRPLYHRGLNTTNTNTTQTNITTTANIIDVQVGGANIFAYTPAYVFANKGDMIRFQFLQVNHTVTQSSFYSPCTALEGGANSGFVPNPEGTPGLYGFNFTVPGDGQFYFYCQQDMHCAKFGMVFEVNPTVDRSYTEFFSRAKGFIQ